MEHVRRYFIEVAYIGTRYGGFQIQENSNTIQGELEKALQTVFRQSFSLTGSSRTDAGVHARSNFFHTDTAHWAEAELARRVYNVNAVLPPDLVVKSIREVPADWHCRFTAQARRYQYTCYHTKDPFLADRGYFFPYSIDMDAMQQAAAYLLHVDDFKTFSKRNTQVHTYQCQLSKSEWLQEGHVFFYQVQGNRFLRGMVRGLVGTMLQVGTGKISQAEFESIVASGDCTRADFSTPPHGLCLEEVLFPWG